MAARGSQGVLPSWVSMPLKAARSLFDSPDKILNLVKFFAQLHVVVGVITVAASAGADVMSSSRDTIRLTGLAECCSFYFLCMGIVGLVGVASSRRGLIIAFMIMSIHAIFIFVPGIVITSSFDIHFYQHNCFGECDWHLLATSMPKNSRCQILCGDHLNENQKRLMTRLGTDYRLDAILIAGAGVELILSILTAFFCARHLCLSHCQRKSVEMVPLTTSTNETKLEQQ